MLRRSISVVVIMSVLCSSTGQYAEQIQLPGYQYREERRSRVVNSECPVPVAVTPDNPVAMTAPAVPTECDIAESLPGLEGD